MKPIMLNGHERALTQIKYNLDGDLLFSAAKDVKPCVWYSHNGERLGTYRGHNGTIWCLDVTYDTKLLLTGSADPSCFIWDVQYGTKLADLQCGSAVRTCGWSYSGKQFFYSTSRQMGQMCELRLFDLNMDPRKQENNPIWSVQMPKEPREAVISSAVWGLHDKEIVTGHDNGIVDAWDLRTTQSVRSVQAHKDKINDLQYSKDQSMLVTASKDCNSKVLDSQTFQELKCFKQAAPVNSAAISPLKDHLCLGGGQDARDVTTTSTRQGKFEAKFFHLVFEEELGRVKGHFGPINTLAFHPDGQSYASGGEDGYIRIHYFDPGYFDFDQQLMEGL